MNTEPRETTPSRPEIPPPGSREWSAVAALLLVGFVLRVALVLHGSELKTRGDQDAYLRGAREMLAGEVFSGPRGPAYPAFLAACQAIGGTELLAPRLANCVLGVLTTLALWALGRRIFGQAAALVAASIWTFHPRSATFPLYLFSEHLYTLAVVAACYFLHRAASGGGRRPTRMVLAAGILLGIGILTREMLLYALVPLLPAFALLGENGPRRNLLPALGIVVTALVVVAPWTVRNYRVHGELIPVAFSSGIPLFEGNYVADTPREIRQERLRLYARFYTEIGRSRLEADRRMREVAWEIIRSRQPTWALEKLGTNLPLLFQPEMTHPEFWLVETEERARILRPAAVVLFLLFHGAVLVLGAVGLAHWPRSGPSAWPLLFLLFSAFAHLVANAGVSRFQLSYEWVFILAAGAAATRGWPQGRSRRLLAAGLILLVALCQIPVRDRWVKPYRGPGAPAELAE